MNAFLDTMTDHVCQYKEGCGAEPFNTITNLSFLIAALYARQLADRQRILTMEVSTAIALTVLVGVGSALFHYFAQVWAMWLDIIPIVLLQCWIVWLYTRRIMNSPMAVGVGLLVVLLGGGFLGSLLPESLNLNGSINYLPAFLILACLAIWHRRHQKREPYVLLAASAAFLIALVFRSIDQISGPAFPMGTHFLWHVFNGGTVYFSLRCLILNLPRLGSDEMRMTS